MSAQKTIAFFDLDGTLTTRDTLLDFLRFSFGYLKTIVGFVRLSPVLIRYAIGIIDNNKVKQLVYSYFFAGISLDRMIFLGESYATNRLPNILRSQGVERLFWHKQNQHIIVIVTASVDYWLKPWTDKMEFELVSTKLESINNLLTGKYLGKNCHGIEKVQQIIKKYDLSTFDDIYAYGDSHGDLHMLKLANKQFFKPFR